MTQPSLFAPDPDQAPVKPVHPGVEQMRLLITVKAAPNPSATYGETVCVAALRLDIGKEGWVRLYPINYRELDQPNKFKKYDIITLDARPNRSDRRPESWRPVVATVTKQGHLPTWNRRLPYVREHVRGTMCGLLEAVRTRPPGRSLAAIRPREVTGFDIEPHPGWTSDERAKIDRYVSQLDLFESAPRTALQAPRFKAWYRYRCHEARCSGHRQGLLDWELVALQRNLTGLDDREAMEALRQRWLSEICAPSNDVVFYVGNQAKREHVFSVLGVFYPRR
ncbi:hypothetical protein [Nonomuraea sp. WAC 01424]|uniref:hypothetical protein n=1 Tax=Nonomuraea sp. WAC 01424 TaxID=2203200 RepID=UPI001C8C1DD1|nr:hypothetical protein [Nonomuraea sp. WAC 01424]